MLPDCPQSSEYAEIITQNYWFVKTAPTFYQPKLAVKKVKKKNKVHVTRKEPAAAPSVWQTVGRIFSVVIWCFGVVVY